VKLEDTEQGVCGGHQNVDEELHVGLVYVVGNLSLVQVGGVRDQELGPELYSLKWKVCIVLSSIKLAILSTKI
jgi:hypothetical protein